ncbi:MAG: lactoylglutathione lyase family protein [Ilumatobacteraceae bacterium]|nr:lactoylglutathione lyase family protein [Ilumatobacteraceae bacterium]
MNTSAPTPIFGVHHVAIVVDDLDAALTFYRDGLGLTEAHRPQFEQPGYWMQAGASQVHLMVGTGPVPKRYHFALGVTDLDAVLERLTRHDIDTMTVPHTPGAGRQAFVRDPFGNTIELNEPDA